MKSGTENKLGYFYLKLLLKDSPHYDLEQPPQPENQQKGEFGMLNCISPCHRVTLKYVTSFMISLYPAFSKLLKLEK